MKTLVTIIEAILKLRQTWQNVLSSIFTGIMDTVSHAYHVNRGSDHKAEILDLHITHFFKQNLVLDSPDKLLPREATLQRCFSHWLPA